MKVRLGYVALSLAFPTCFKTITYTRYKSVCDGDARLDSIIRHNLACLKDILRYNYVNNVHFYRISHNIVPLATHPLVDFDYITPYNDLWREIGQIVFEYGIRVDVHPDHFCVINSSNPSVVGGSIESLRYISSIFKAMGVDGKAILHVGGSYGDKVNSMKVFMDNFRKLDKDIRDMIVLENDDKIYNVKDTLMICQELDIPMVLDYHHYVCNNDGEDICDYLPDILKTWDNECLNPKMHFSSPKSFKDKRSHSDYINVSDFIHFLDVLRPLERDVDVMLE